MPQEDKELHIITETLAIIILAPYLWNLSNKVEKKEDFYILRSIVIFTIIVDGYLLYKWKREK